ncbi:sugar phosphate isomerase/epimerase [Marinactinospora endophytica]
MTAPNPPAVQLYTLRDRLAQDRAATLRAVADLGYRAVEPFDVVTDPAGLRVDLDAAGLTVCSVHAPALDPDTRDAAFAGAATVGAGTVVVPFQSPERFLDAAALRDLAADLNTAAAAARRRGLRLGYHNHDFELSTRIDGRPALEALADLLDPDVLLEVDVYWAAVGGVEVPPLLQRLGDRARYLHVKDGPVNREEPMTAVGSGRMPIAQVLAASRAEWHIVELDHCAGDVLTAVGDSLDWLVRNDLAGVGEA